MPFKKGHKIKSPGRPPGSLSLVDMLKRKLKEIPHGCDDAYAEQIIEKYLKEILNGKSELLKDAFDRIDGKPPQSIKHQGDEDNPIEYNYQITFVE